MSDWSTLARPTSAEAYSPDGLISLTMKFGPSTSTATGRLDVAGLVDGEWHVGIALNNHAIWVTWADVAWQDVRVGDFDGDGRDDLAGRAGGQWWVTTSDGNGVVSTSLWATWSDLAWQDVTVGDYDGDGADDIAGRYAGEWWVGTSTGTASLRRFGRDGLKAGWDAVFAGDATGVPLVTSTTSERQRHGASAAPQPAEPGLRASTSSRPPRRLEPVPLATIEDDEPLKIAFRFRGGTS